MVEPYKLRLVRLQRGFHATPEDGEQRVDWLGPLSRLNVLIGPNNSGKSRLLRAIMRPPTDSGSIIVRPLGWSDFEDVCEQLRQHLAKCAPPTSSFHSSLAELASKLFGFDEGVLGAGKHEDMHLRVRDRVKELVGIVTSPAFRNQFSPADWGLASDLIQRMREAQKVIAMNLASPLTMNCVYVPSLRSMRLIPGDNPASKVLASLTDLVQDPLSRMASADYDLPIASPLPSHGQVHSALQIHSGQSLYAIVQRRLLGSYQERMWVKRYEAYLTERFFQGQQVSLIPRIGEPMHIKIGNATERPIAQLGDGLQQVVLLTYPYMLTPTAHTLLFVEEPELYLHPGFQRALIEAWLDYQPAVEASQAGSLQVFAATHSSQFLDLTLERKSISVFRCAATLSGEDGSERDTNIVVSRVGDDARCILEELGMRNSAVLLCNCTVWVEGITDRMYLRHWLDLYWRSCKQGGNSRRYLEDVHFAFVEYSGANITHWSFLDKPKQPKGMDPETICGELFLIADLDDPTLAAKAERHALLEGALTDRYRRLPVREIENLLTPATIANVVYAGDTKPVPQPSFSHEDYKKESLGAFIDTHVPEEREPGVLYRSRKYSTDSGTIRDKRSFAERAIQAMPTWDDLSPEAQELVMAVAAFIQKHNP